MSSVLIGAGIVLNILPLYTPQEITVNAVIEGEIDTMHNPSGVTIDLFDYSLYYTDADGNLKETESTAASNGTNARPFGTTRYQCAADATSGINFAGTANGRNYMHLLRFFQELKGTGSYTANSGSGVTRGLINPTLDANGYPTVSDKAFTLQSVYSSSSNIYNLSANKGPMGYAAPNGNYRGIIDTSYVDGIPQFIDYNGTRELVVKTLVDETTYDSSTGEITAWFVSDNGHGQAGTVILNTPELPDSLSNESLDYLFDPTIDHAGKVSYTDVQELLTVNAQGHYIFDSATEKAIYNEARNVFDVREYRDNEYHGFFPFNEFVPQSDKQYAFDHYFGIHMQIDGFSMPQNGQVLDHHGNYSDMIFSFAGDDDVWIFIDGYLVMDLGGCRSSATTTIDFATGEITCGTAPNVSGLSWDKASIYGTTLKAPYTLRDVFRALDAEDTEAWNGETFAEGTYHTLDFFYLERGNGNSNMKMDFNIVSTYDFTAHKAYINNTLAENDFTYTLKGYDDPDGTPAIMPTSEIDEDIYWSGVTRGSDDVGNYSTLTTNNSLDGCVNFGNFSRDEVVNNNLLNRSFRYVVEEIPPAGAIKNIDGSYSVTDPNTGIVSRYDGTKYYFTGYFYEDSNGDIWVSKWYYSDDTYTTRLTDVNFMDFRNVYNVASVPLTITKTLNGRDWQQGEEYTFTLYDADDNDKELTTVTASANETVTFDPLCYTEPGTHHYRISETSTLPRGISPSDPVEVTVEVAYDSSNVLKATVTYTNNDLIINTYDASGSVELTATKVLSGRDWKPGETFEFTLLDDTGAVIDTQTVTEAEKTVTFDAIDYDLSDVGETYTYTISETSTLPGGVTSSGDITATVKITDNGDGTLATNITYTNDDKITNTYTAAPVTAAITVNKTINGYMQGSDNTFTVQLNNEHGMMMERDITTVGGVGSTTFPALTYYSVGTYTYTVTETAGNAAGITYDSNTYNVVVTITDDLEGHLVASIGYGGTATAVDVVNTFAEESVDVTLTVNKTITDLSGSAPDGSYTFELCDSTGAVIQTKTVDTANLSGSVDFDAINFTTAGDYNYTIREAAGTAAGIEYDTHEYQLVIHVTDNVPEAKLEATVDVDGTANGQISFTNVYNPGTAYATIQVTKVINDTSGSAGPATFEFTLRDDGQNVIDTKTIDGEGTVSFEPIPFTQIGTYNYTITETDGDAAGYIYDSTAHAVQVNVTDAGGRLEATVDYGTGTSLSITNTYDPTVATAKLRARKVVDDQSNSAPAEPFTFELLDNSGATVETVTVDGAGYVDFTSLVFDRVGTYEYTIREVSGNTPGFTYDTTEKKVTVTVSDDGTGMLQSAIAYEGDEAVFTNTYCADPADLQLSVNKIVEGDGAPDVQFNFNLLDDQGTVLQTKSITGAGSVDFDPIAIDKAGTYTYYVFETEGTEEAFVYDGSRYTVTVTVIDNGGVLVATYALQKIVGQTTTVENDITFTNSYEPTPTDTPTPTPTDTVTPTPTDTVTPTPTDTVTPTPTDNPTDTVTPTPNITTAPQPTPTVAPTDAEAASRTDTPTPTDVITSTGEDDSAVTRALIGITLIGAAMALATVSMVKKRRYCDKR